LAAATRSTVPGALVLTWTGHLDGATYCGERGRTGLDGTWPRAGSLGPSGCARGIAAAAQDRSGWMEDTRVDAPRQRAVLTVVPARLVLSAGTVGDLGMRPAGGDHGPMTTPASRRDWLQVEPGVIRAWDYEDEA
jgi:hypothetical protein